MALTITSPVGAQDDPLLLLPDDSVNPVSVVVGAEVMHDSNLFRQPDSVARTADKIRSTYVGLRIDKQASLQRFQLDLTKRRRHYEKTRQLDFDSFDYRGAWLWQVGPHFSGTLSADRTEALVPFEDVLTPGNNARNVRVTENRAFTLDAWAAADWHVVVGVSQTSQKSEQTFAVQPDFKAVTHEAGVKYAPASGSFVSLIRRSSNGDYVNQSSTPILGSGYRQEEHEITVHWLATGKSTLTGKAAWLDRKQAGAPQRNFSGPAGELIYTWLPTGKLTVNVIAKRDLLPFQDLSASYIVNNTVSVGSTWSITAKTAAYVRASQTRSSFGGAASVPVTGPARKDKSKLFEVGVNWSPRDRLVFRADLAHHKRDSNLPGYAHKGTIARITATYRF